MAFNFQEALSKNADEYKRPPLLPEGTYYGTVTAWEGQTSSKKGTPGVQISGNYTHADPNVELVTDEGEPLSLEGRKFYFTFWASENGTNFHRLSKFLKDMGLNTSGRPMDQLLEELRGQMVQIDVKQVPSQDGSEMVNNTAGLAPIQD